MDGIENLIKKGINMENKIEKQFVTESGFEAFVVINESRTRSWRCGYVIIPEESSLFKMDVSYCVNLYDLDLDDPNIIAKLKQQQKLYNINVHVYNINVHGGITYNDFYDGKGYCIGFDCGHYQDTIEVQTLEYCINECENLAKQLKEIETLVC